MVLVVPQNTFEVISCVALTEGLNLALMDGYSLKGGQGVGVAEEFAAAISLAQAALRAIADVVLNGGWQDVLPLDLWQSYQTCQTSPQFFFFYDTLYFTTRKS